uniref:Ig-like domain-containing protein n=1 Tax=Amphiprion percula TaxID=161767 RepID=A0A3P8T7R5_AMPPE
MKLKLTDVSLCFTVIRLSDTEEEQNNLTGTEGGNITLPDPVLERGYLLYEGNVIAQVINRVLIIDEGIYINKLHWNNNSGLFTITDLQKRDSGIYKIDSKKGVISTKSIYSLTVYGKMVFFFQTCSRHSDSCYLLCAVDKAAEITLWWYKDEEVVNQSSSAGSLPLTVTKQDLSSSYRCVAGNPAEERTLLVDLQTFCGENSTAVQNNTESRHRKIILMVTLSLGSYLLA